MKRKQVPSAAATYSPYRYLPTQCKFVIEKVHVVFIGEAFYLLFNLFHRPQVPMQVQSEVKSQENNTCFVTLHLLKSSNIAKISHSRNRNLGPCDICFLRKHT